jgi:flagellar motor switch protein FliM
VNLAVRPHDFRRTETLDRQHIETLNAAFDAFTRHASVELSTLMRKPTQLSLSRIAESPWRDVTAQLGEQPYLATFSLDPLPGSAILSTPLATAIRLIDFRLGGGSGPHFDRHAALTETDLAVLSGIIRPLLEKLSDSLSRLREVTATLAAQDSSIQFVQMAGPTEMFLVVELQLSVSSDPAVTMIVALPFPLVRQLTEVIHSGVRADEEEDQRVDPAVVLFTPIQLWVEIPPIEVTPQEISDLAVGDVIQFLHPLKQPLDVRAEGVLVARASRGHVGSKIVCSITEEIADDDH